MLAILLVSEFFVCLSFVTVNVANLSSNDGYFSHGACFWQSFSVMCAWGTSSWINASIAIELYRLLSRTKRLLRYVPPTRKVVILRCFVIWILCTSISAFVFIPRIPYKPRLFRGLICAPASNGTHYGISIMIHAFVLPLFVGAPTCTTICILIVCLRQGLFDFEIRKHEMAFRARNHNPTSTRLHEMAAHRSRVAAARAVTTHFLRGFICQFMWYPAMIALLGAARSIAPIVIGVSLIALQSFATAVVAFLKSDVREATLSLIPRCRRHSWVRPPQVMPSSVSPSRIRVTQIAESARDLSLEGVES